MGYMKLVGAKARLGYVRIPKLTLVAMALLCLVGLAACAIEQMESGFLVGSLAGAFAAFAAMADHG